MQVFLNEKLDSKAVVVLEDGLCSASELLDYVRVQKSRNHHLNGTEPRV
jgi:hypothetical protein